MQMEGRRRPTAYIAIAVIILVLVGWLIARYRVKRTLLANLSSNDMKVRVDAARKLLEMGKLSDSLPAQAIIVRSKTAEALGEIGSGDALAALAEILRDQEEKPRQWARRALVKQGMRAMPVLLAALSAGGGTRDETIEALKQIGPQTAPELRFFLSDGSAYGAAATALAKVRGVGVDALVRGCYCPDGDVRGAALSSMGLEGLQAAVEPALYNLRPLADSQKGPAMKALGLLKAKRAVPVIIPFLKDKDNRETAVTALGQIGDQRAVEPILATLMETEKRYRNAAILALGRIGPPAFPALIRELRSPEVLLRRAAADALVGSDSPQVSSALMAALRDSDEEVRASAARSLGWQGNVEAVPALVAAVSDSSWRVVDAAVSALGDIGVGAVDKLLAVLGSPAESTIVRYQISRALIAVGRPAVPKLVTALGEPSPSVQKWAAVSLGQIGDPSAVGALKRLESSPDPDVRWVVQEQLRRLTSLTGT
jgi:HEAT repeat protein